MIHNQLGFAPPPGVAAAAMLVATAVLFVPGMLSLPDGPPPAPSIFALIALGVVFTGLTLRLFYGLIAEIGPGRASLAFYLSPGVAVILGWLVLEEPISWSTVLGLGAIVAGSVMTSRRTHTQLPTKIPGSVS